MGSRLHRWFLMIPPLVFFPLSNFLPLGVGCTWWLSSRQQSMTKVIGCYFCDWVTKYSILQADPLCCLLGLLCFDEARCCVGEVPMAREWEKPMTKSWQRIEVFSLWGTEYSQQPLSELGRPVLPWSNLQRRL